MAVLRSPDWPARLGLGIVAALACQSCGAPTASEEAPAAEDGQTSSSGDGYTSRTEVDDKTVELTTEQSSANIPLGIPELPQSETAYEMDSGEDGKLKYSGSFNTQMSMQDAMQFYADAIAEKGGEITRDDRKEGRSFQSIEGTLPDDKTFYVHVTDLKKKRGYTQVDLKLSEK